MDQRYATSPDQLPHFDTAALRDRFLVQDLFIPGEVRVAYTHHDRIVLGGAVPAGAPLPLPVFEELRAEYFLAHREMGIVNVGGSGTVTADGEVHTLPNGACLYLGRGTRDVVFADAPDGDEGGAQFYLFSAPAHTAYPSQLVLKGQGTARELGDQLTSNRRSLNQYIHENGIKSCQIVMGVTELHPGSMWNTMPAHTHDRRTECYLYFDVPQDARVIHLMGRPDETRHLVVADRQAVISPSWSLHSGVGTAAYSFVWAMAGENQSFDDMDAVPVTILK
ncbi:4-deoxy-L-threo-5-hexosulose-uronate ketol-isomerase [Sinomonas atrocyanea]|uniref:4-deoxy-L-threo-5-hexosulose-uronate ketol-isomerase n=1 Tax=Sinomonas atrocyanea TaxID=37927 RepID=A0A127A6E2_9MICC|nr:5-dehydro-4-deoxy-D-glucuronate isomerase [Sinomonas atrocyanea]AMM34344.1 4-deoxy-L-threo-5-hexosulose-uronate ketol-isomerase [Sinomonas atrocyanea]GEB64575.1 4-deoxy-L-threo-5-hexosulose-uronate ketol-isomerase 1 [Sinomonas atrocyanea]GGG63825.1 4-deoxy-L-threo-5-hexosulose-uronate ketol-isomerase 1 [Sinomonas atrocyanea]